MKELIERWRNTIVTTDMQGSITGQVLRECADELQAWLDSLWTEITEDPKTWPHSECLIRFADSGNIEKHGRVVPQGLTRYRGDMWRPIIPGIDTVNTI